MILSKRTRNFQFFLNHLLYIPSIKASEILYDFLTVSNEIDFSKTKTDYEISPSSNKLENLRNLQGILYCKYNKNYDTQNSFIKDYLKQKDNLLGKLYSAYSNLQDELKKVSNLVTIVSETYKQLKSISIEFHDPLTISDTYSNLEKIYKDLSCNYNKQVNIIETEFKDFFEYFRQEIISFKEKTEIFEDLKEEYFKAFKNLQSKKERLFILKNLQKWELKPEEFETADANVLNNKPLAFKIMCYEDSTALEKKLRKLGVCSYSLLNEMHKFKLFYGKMFHYHFSNMSARNTEFLSDVFLLIKVLNLNNNESIKRNNTISTCKKA